MLRDHSDSSNTPVDVAANPQYVPYRSKRHSRNLSEKLIIVQPTPASPLRTSVPITSIEQPAEDDNSLPEGRQVTKQQPEPEPEPAPEPAPEAVSPVPSASSSTSTAPTPTATTSTAELPPTPRKSSTFRRVVPRKAQAQASVKVQTTPTSPSPLSQSTSSPAFKDDRALPSSPPPSIQPLPQPELAMPRPVQPPPKAASLAPPTSPAPISIPTAPKAPSQPSSPINLPPPSPPQSLAPTPSKPKSAPKRAPYRPGFQPTGFKRPRTDEFLVCRRVARDGSANGDGRKRMERVKLERRLEKLISLHFPEGKERPAPLHRSSSIFDLSFEDIKNAGGSGLWKGVVGGNARNDIRASEQRITPWQDDSEVTRCPICSSSFHPLTNRKHHCRLCGKIICNLPVKIPARPTSCSLLFVVDSKTRRIEQVGEGVDYGVRKHTSSGPDQKKRDEEEDKFLKGVRICKDCRPVVLRQQYLREMTTVPTFMRLYEALVTLEKEIEDSLPQFQEMVLTMGQDSSSPLQTSKEATATRKRLLEGFAQYDALAKRIRMLPGEDGKPVKPNSSQDRVRMAIVTRANLFLQKNMFPLQSLPKQQPKSSTGTPSQTPPPQDQEANSPVLDVDSQTAMVLQPLLEQEALLETFVEEATAQRKFDDARTLRMSLKEIRDEIDKIVKRSKPKTK